MLDSNHYLCQPGRERHLAQAVRRVALQPSFYIAYGKGLLHRALAVVLLGRVPPLPLLLAGLLRVTLGSNLIHGKQRIDLQGEPSRFLRFRTRHPGCWGGKGGETRMDRRLGQDRLSGVDRRQPQVAFDGSGRRLGVGLHKRQSRQVKNNCFDKHESEQDPQHTRLDRMIRATTLDGLPQLFRALRRDLSQVRTRRQSLEAVAICELWQHARHRIRPGITSCWHIPEREIGVPIHRPVDVALAHVKRVCLDPELLTLASILPARVGVHGRGLGR